MYNSRAANLQNTRSVGSVVFFFNEWRILSKITQYPCRLWCIHLESERQIEHKLRLYINYINHDYAYIGILIASINLTACMIKKDRGIEKNIWLLQFLRVILVNFPVFTLMSSFILHLVFVYICNFNLGVGRKTSEFWCANIWRLFFIIKDKISTHLKIISWIWYFNESNEAKFFSQNYVSFRIIIP